MTAVYEYTFARKRIAPNLGQVRVPDDVAEVARKMIGDDETESFLVFFLDTKNNVIGFERTYRGNLAGASVRVGEVFRGAVRTNAAAIIIVHNHPSGDVQPSGEDLHLTTEIAAGGKILDIELLDHVIVGSERFTSLRGIGAIGGGKSS